MELMQDGVVAALAAIGVTALLWLAASVLLYRESPVDAVYVMRVSGDAAGLDAALRILAQNRRLPVLLVDCGGTPGGIPAGGRQCEAGDAGGAGVAVYGKMTGEVSLWASV